MDGKKVKTQNLGVSEPRMFWDTVVVGKPNQLPLHAGLALCANVCLSVCNEQQDSPKPVKPQASDFPSASQSWVPALTAVFRASLS